MIWEGDVDMRWTTPTLTKWFRVGDTLTCRDLHIGARVFRYVQAKRNAKAGQLATDDDVEVAE